MKMKNKLYLLAVTAAALSMSVKTGVGQVFDFVEALNNRAIAASPRAKEAFPWLVRSGTELPRSKAAVTTSRSALVEMKENRALAASPRMKELFPELARTAVSPSENTVAPALAINPLSEVRRNSALAASPRMKELFPELARGAEKAIEIAPLK